MVGAGQRRGEALGLRLLPSRKLAEKSAGGLQSGGVEEGANTRFVVTNKDEKLEELHGSYAGRGETENRTKDFDLAPKADRPSRKRFWANPFRLLLHAAAYRPLEALRKPLVKAGVRRIQLVLASFPDRGRRPDAPVAHQGAPAPGVRAPRTTPVEDTCRRADGVYRNNTG